MSNKSTLGKELRLAGAKQSETDGLLDVAARLHHLTNGEAVYRPAGRRRWQLASLGLATVTGLLIGAALVAYAQTSLPGSWLYPAKRASEKVAVAIDPGYRATLMMRRSQEVAALVRHHSGQPIILATLADYRAEAAAYKSTNYAAFEYCKNNLQQAAAIAPGQERSAIANTLSSLQT